MSLLNTLVWWQWAVLAAIPLGIVLLYFLKLKRQPLEVPSTFLWSRTVEDLHVNSIWQRLRKNLLLLLQLLVILLLIIALLRPGWRGEELIGDRFVFLIDNSASMNATDREPTRLEAAKQRAMDLVGQMEPGDVAMVISFSDSAKVLQTFTDSRRALRLRISQIEPTHRSTNLHEALRAAGGLANPGFTRLQDNQAVDEALPATLYILSDGCFPAIPDFSLGQLEPRYIPIGKVPASNLGIIAFAIERNPERPDQIQVFANVVNSGPKSVAVQLELYFNGESLDVVELDVPGDDTGGWHFDLPDLDVGRLKLVMTPQDALESDNTAYAVLNRPGLAKVLLVTPGNVPLLIALETEQARKVAAVTVADPSLLKDPSFQAGATAGTYDLIIFDRCSPVEPPQANTLFIKALPPGDTWQAKETAAAPYVIDIDQIHPLTQLVDMDHVKIATGLSLKPPRGYTVLFDSVDGPLFAIAPRAGFEDAVLGFSLFDMEDGQTIPNTTWPLRPSFPVFVYNLLRYLGGHHGDLNTANVEPGTPVTIRPQVEADQVTIVDPLGNESRPDRLENRALVTVETELPGIYEVYEHGVEDATRRFAVNLFSQNESNIAPAASLELGYETVAALADHQATRRELWKWVLLAGLLLLLFEWYIYNRRVYL